MVAGGGQLPPGVSGVDTANMALQQNPTRALPAAGRGAVTGGVPMVGSDARQIMLRILRGLPLR
jgi:hypothetical protein